MEVFLSASFASVFIVFISGFTYDIPYTSDGLNQVSAASVFKFSAEKGDIDINHGGVGIKMDIPDVFDNAASGTHLVFITNEVFQQGKFFWRKGHFAGITECLMGSGIYLQRTSA